MLPKVGVVKMREALRFDGKILGARVSREAERWSISIHVQLPEDYHRTRTADGQVGVDLGITHLATLSKVLSLAERLFVCHACGHIEDRDLNAAKNINQLGQAMPEVTPVESRALVMVPIMTQLNSRKQELPSAHVCALRK